MLNKVILKRANEQLELEIEDLRFHKQFVIIKFMGINNIGEAISLKNYEILISDEDKLLLPEDHYYVSEIIGCQVYTLQGFELGEIVEVITTGGADIFVVHSAENEYMIPASKEMISEIDLVNNKLIVDPIEGLLDL